MGLKPQLCVKFHQAVELIGSRWTGAVIQLLLQKRMRFAELRDAIPDIVSVAAPSKRARR